MAGLPPSYDEVSTGPGAATIGAPPPQVANSGQYPTAAQEKANIAKTHAAQDTGEKRLVIWHAPTGNSLITAADEKTPIYNIVDSRAPDEKEQEQLSQRVQQLYEEQQQKGNYKNPQGHPPGYTGNGGSAGIVRQNPSSSAPPGEVEFAEAIKAARANPRTAQHHRMAEVWLQTVRRGGDRNSEPIAIIKRHINTRSAVSLDFNGFHTGIVQHAGFPHTKYEIKWHDRTFTWKRTHSAPGTSKFDGGSYVCKDDKKKVYAYSTSEDSRCDGSLIFEDDAVNDGLVDMLSVTGYVIRSLDDENNAPSYSRYNGGGMGGYGPYGSPYGRAYGFYPTPLMMPFLL